MTEVQILKSMYRDAKIIRFVNILFRLVHFILISKSILADRKINQYQNRNIFRYVQRRAKSGLIPN